jgi:hypothetical protein
MGSPKPKWGSTPWTDLRALSSSFAFHALLLLLASAVALSISLPRNPPPPGVIRGELGPVDNRVQDSTGGGSPGDSDASEPDEHVRITAEGSSARDSAAEALLAEALPENPSADTSLRDLPASATNLGGLASQRAGGGGSGGGIGTGVGRGVGPSAEFFGARETANSFTYVIDCSGSMSANEALGLAKRELLTSLSQLPPDARFGVIFFNLEATPLTNAAGASGLMDATAANKERVRTRLRTIPANGGTDPKKALLAAFAQQPEVVFFLTDGQEMTREMAAELKVAAGSTRVQAIEFGGGPNPRTTGPLESLAIATGGSYRYIDVLRYNPASE